MKYKIELIKAVIELDCVVARIISLGRELHENPTDDQESYELILDLKREIDKLDEYSMKEEGE